MAALLWLYTFLVTIVLVNLLIAQMSSTYEAVKDNAEQLALYQKVELFLEYKDNREVLPPPLNLVVILCYRLPKLTVQFFARFCCRVGTFEMMQVPPPHPSPEVLLRPSLWVLMPLPFVMMQESWLLFRKPPPPGFLSPRAAVKAVELLRREHRRARHGRNRPPAPTHIQPQRMAMALPIGPTAILARLRDLIPARRGPLQPSSHGRAARPLGTWASPHVRLARSPIPARQRQAARPLRR